MAEEDVTVEDLNRALQLFRRILRRILVILILGIAGSIVLNLIGEKINPHFGILMESHLEPALRTETMCGMRLP